MKRLILGLAIGGIVFAGCGNGNDTLSKIAGPNPISDAHAALSRANDNGWNDARKAALAQQFLDKYGMSPAQAACVAEYFTSNFSWADLTNQNRYPTQAEETASEAAIRRCVS